MPNTLKPAWQTKEWAAGRKKFKGKEQKKVYDDLHKHGWPLGENDTFEIIDPTPDMIEANDLDPGEKIIHIIRADPYALLR